MFDDIGGKIKKLATVVCWTGIIASVISGLMIWSQGLDGDAGIIVFFSGLFTMALGACASWVGTFLLYGFGEIIENLEVLNNNTYEIHALINMLGSGDTHKTGEKDTYVNKTTPTSPPTPSIPRVQPIFTGGWYCTKCGAKNDGTAQFCSECGEYK